MRRLVLAVLCCLGAAGSAQPGDLSAGYSFERTTGDDAVSRHGWNVSAGLDVTGNISLAVDAAGHYGTADGVKRSQLTLMAGPRFWYVRGERYGLFAQAMGGLLRETASLDVLDVTISESESRFGILSGVGLDVKVADRWSVRLSGDYVWSTRDGSSRGGFRAGLGAAWRF